MGKSPWTSDLTRRSTLPKLVEKKEFYIPHLGHVFPSLTLTDRYWQFRLRTYRHAFIHSPVEQVQKVHSKFLMRQIVKDTHPIFGAYILYVHALELRTLTDFNKSLDCLQFALEWLWTWQVKDLAPWDLPQKVVHDVSG
jgi:hypothetical protein